MDNVPPPEDEWPIFRKAAGRAFWVGICCAVVLIAPPQTQWLAAVLLTVLTFTWYLRP